MEIELRDVVESDFAIFFEHQCDPVSARMAAFGAKDPDRDRGIATAALSRLLQRVATRPVYASAAKDNVGSLRVLAKCGFAVRASRRAFANARGEEIDEVLLELR